MKFFVTIVLMTMSVSSFSSDVEIEMSDKDVLIWQNILEDSESRLAKAQQMKKMVLLAKDNMEKLNPLTQEYLNALENYNEKVESYNKLNQNRIKPLNIGDRVEKVRAKLSDVELEELKKISESLTEELLVDTEKMVEEVEDSSSQPVRGLSLNIKSYSKVFRKALRSKDQQLFLCYQEWKRRYNREDDKINTLISVKSDGSIDHIGFPDTTNHNLARCVAQVIYKTSFPQTGYSKIIKIGQPFRFTFAQGQLERKISI